MKTNDLGLLILRISVAGLMLFHGVAKLGGIGPIKAMLASNGLPVILGYGVYITEIVAPILIIVGWRIRLASLVFFAGMVAAMFLAHAQDIFTLTKTGGLKIELVLLFIFPALTLFFTGAGKYAISTKNKWD